MKRIDLIKTGGFAAGENIATVEVSPPEASKGEVIIEVKASAVNPVDWKIALMGFFLPETMPAALGCDVAGVVTSASEGNEHLIGKRVLTYLGASKMSNPTNRGAFVEQVAADADVVVEIPDDMSFAAAATIPVGALTAELLLNELPTKDAGDWVLIYGASSSVGYFCTQIAAKRGLRAIGVASSKHESALKDLGIAGFVDYTKEDVEAKVKELCGDEHLNGAADCIGAPTTFSTCMNLVASLGDPALSLTVSSTGAMGLPDPPAGVKRSSVNLGFALEQEDSRLLVKTALPEIVQLKTQPIHFVAGPFSAETVEHAFQISQDGVSGEKVVIEWTP